MGQTLAGRGSGFGVRGKLGKGTRERGKGSGRLPTINYQLQTERARGSGGQTRDLGFGIRGEGDGETGVALRANEMNGLSSESEGLPQPIVKVNL